MGISLDVTAKNGDKLSYGRLTELVMDFATHETKAILGGYTSKQTRQLGQPATEVLVAEFVMPYPVPEDLVSHGYAQLIAQHPDIDFTEV